MKSNPEIPRTPGQSAVIQQIRTMTSLPPEAKLKALRQLKVSSLGLRTPKDLADATRQLEVEVVATRRQIAMAQDLD